MKTVLVTGAGGFIGKNLCAQLTTDKEIELLRFDRDSTEDNLREYIKNADIVFHLAGVNRPLDEKDFDTGNRELTERILSMIKESDRQIPVVITSSIQAEKDNAYGKSKKAAEELVFNFGKGTNTPVFVYRLPNVFGKWCKPNYNSVVATFCNNIATGLPVVVNDPSTELTLVYIDDVIREFVDVMNGHASVHDDGYSYVKKTFKTTLGQLKQDIEELGESRTTLVMPNLDSEYSRDLYATYISYFAEDNFSYALKTNTDDRGWLAEFIKSRQFGQIFVSKTKPGISRGNHWHNTKIEKFLVVDGKAEIAFRKMDASNAEIIRYQVSGDKLTVLDIPTGYAHSIKNIGDTDLTTIFWADEILNPERPDTIYENVEEKQE
ncbi:MAG: NAD-dependent epimerase/dehydratase family protein [Candidatus Saccharimonadales bacterium]